MAEISTALQNVLGVPAGLIKEELSGLYGTNVLSDMYNIIRLYDTYENGAPYTAEISKDYVPADLRYKKTQSLINKIARFMFSKTPDFYVDPVMGDSQAEIEANKQAADVYKNLIDAVLKENGFSLALLKAAKDCFIGKRVALMFNINEDTGIQLSFLPSLEFVYDVDPNNANLITKIVVFYNLNTNKDKKDQRIYKKKFWLENGYAHYSEKIYDGSGNPVEVIVEDETTLFDFIPCWVIVNDGLTGDLMGNSEVDNIQDYESWYSRLASADMDAERKGMNPVRYTIDASPDSTKDLSIAAGAFWDLASDQNQSMDRSAQVGVLDTPMSYSAALSTTLDRIGNIMHEQSAVPNVSPEALQGVVTSGKTLKAIYWDLIVRCDEKMLAWRPALEFLAGCIIEGVRLYPKAGEKYLNGEILPDAPYSIRVDNQYSLPEDEAEEKQIDIAEVSAQTMSRKSYMKKWRGLTDDEADEELKQIAAERAILEDSYSAPVENGTEAEEQNVDEGNSEEETGKQNPEKQEEEEILTNEES